MERLTGRFSNGQAYVKGCGENCKYDFKYCRTYSENCPTMTQIYENLAHYEDLEEAGKLITLPCKRGDTVYYIYMDCPSDYKEVYCIDHQGGCANCHHRVPTIMSKKYTLDDIDMPVYLTEQEAEKALERMRCQQEKN